MSFDTDPRITIFTGHYGSGKTEISINYALQMQKQFANTFLIDLDFVNPYFRSREARAYLRNGGVEVIASAEEYFNTDVPAFSPQIIGALKDKKKRVIVDLGGDEIGARAAGRFRNQIVDGEYELLFVVNPYRPFTSTLEEIKGLLQKIETVSRLKVTALVSNPNLTEETTLEDIITGHTKVLEIADRLSLPLKMLAAEDAFVDEISKLPAKQVLSLTRVMLKPWEQN